MGSVTMMEGEARDRETVSGTYCHITMKHDLVPENGPMGVHHHAYSGEREV